MTKAELIELVRKIQASEGTEKEIDEMIDIVEKNVPAPGITDYIFYEDLPAEEVVEKALNYKVIRLNASSE
jgi:hypothetical protein